MSSYICPCVFRFRQESLPRVAWLERRVYVFLILIDAARLLSKKARIHISPPSMYECPLLTLSLLIVTSFFKCLTVYKAISNYYHFLQPLGNINAFFGHYVGYFCCVVYCSSFAWSILLAFGFFLGKFVRAVYIEQISTLCHLYYKYLDQQYHLSIGFVYQPDHWRMIAANCFISSKKNLISSIS